jgi:hypothetical protein
LSTAELQNAGKENLKQTKLFDYGVFALKATHGVGAKKSSYKSFEDMINMQFKLKPTAPSIRESKRCGLIGYKVGMTHFWNKWGQIVPCSVI